MARFTLDIPDNLNDWLQQQADNSRQSKNQYVAWLIEHFKSLGEYERGFNLALEALCEFEQVVRKDATGSKAQPISLYDERWLALRGKH